MRLLNLLLLAFISAALATTAWSADGSYSFNDEEPVVTDDLKPAPVQEQSLEAKAKAELKELDLEVDKITATVGSSLSAAARDAHEKYRRSHQVVEQQLSDLNGKELTQEAKDALSAALGDMRDAFRDFKTFSNQR